MTTFPPSLILELTAKCNFSCPFCYCPWHEYGCTVPDDMPTHKWKNILDKCASSDVKNITFSGGEALLRKDLSELISYASMIMPETKLGVFTNGSLLTKEFFFFCKNHNISLCTSLQGLKTFREMTGSDFDYQDVLDNLAFAAENDHPMDISLTASKINYSEFVEMFQACCLSGANFIQMGAVMAEGRALNNLQITLTRCEWEQLKDTIRQLPNGGTPFSFCDEMICECRQQEPELLKRFAAPEPQPCPAGVDFGVISPDGKFRKCLHLRETFTLDV